MNSFDFSNLGPEALVIGGLLHLHWRVSRLEHMVQRIGELLGTEKPPTGRKWKGVSLWLLPPLLALLCGCASVRQTLTTETTAPDGTTERRTLSVSLVAAGDARNAVEKLRASNAKTQSVGVEGAAQESQAPALAELLVELLRKAAK